MSGSVERLQRRPIGEGCQCVDNHLPAAYVGALHHVLPQSWGGQTVPGNLVMLCPNSHTATHRLIDEYVRAGGDPGWEVRRHFGVYVRTLALRAWQQRPAHPTLTSLVAPHGTYLSEATER